MKKRWISGWLTILLALCLLPGCSALEALEQIKDRDGPESSDSSVSEPSSVSSSGGETSSTLEPAPSSGGEEISTPEPAPPSGSERPTFPENEWEPESDPLDFEDENALRTALEGEWAYCQPTSDDPAAWITFSGEGGYCLRVRNPENDAILEYRGFCQLEHWEAGEGEAPDMMILTLSETTDKQVGSQMNSIGDYRIEQKTLCDGEVVLGLLQLNNGESVFSLYFNEMYPIWKRYTGWQLQGEGRKAETFCAAAWKIDYGTQTVWLDDAMADGSNIGRHEALPYQAAGQLDLSDLPDWPLSDGSLWTVQTDDWGRVVKMQPCIYGSDGQLTEEEAAILLCEFGEVQGYLEQGMTMLFEGGTEVIGEEPCVVIALGTDHGEAFVRERFYAVSPSGRIYVYDPFTDAWNAAKMD